MVQCDGLEDPPSKSRLHVPVRIKRFRGFGGLGFRVLGLRV